MIGIDVTIYPTEVIIKKVSGKTLFMSSISKRLSVFIRSGLEFISVCPIYFLEQSGHVK
jgi:hypothetical protein